MLLETVSNATMKVSSAIIALMDSLMTSLKTHVINIFVTDQSNTTAFIHIVVLTALVYPMHFTMNLQEDATQTATT